MGYWEDRLGKSITNLFDKNTEQARKQLIKYYKKAMEDIVGQFEKTYQHLLSSMDEGREPTPADLYNLDKYWEMQAQLKTKLQKLGDTTYKVMSDNFVNQFKSVYEGLELPFSARAFNTLSDENINQMILQIWCADGKSWSDRIWTNTDKLQQALNDNLINCVLTGKKPTELKQMLMKDFNVSFNNADTIVRTEIARIQTQAAVQRYKDYGLDEVEILADKDERRCDVCGKLHGKRFKIGANLPIPAHPRCRCSVIPVLDQDKLEANNPTQQALKNDNTTKSSNLLTSKSTDDSIEIPKDMFKQSSKSLRKGIKNAEKKIDEHLDKIANPEKYFKDWRAFPESRKQREIKHWKREIEVFIKNNQAAKKLLKQRGEE